MNLALTGLTNSYSTDHLNKLRGTSQYQKKQNSSNTKNTSMEKSSSKKELKEPNLCNTAKLESFLRKQHDFVEKRKRSIEKIRQLLEIQYDKENPHRPKISEASLTMAKNKLHGSNTLNNTISSSVLMERSMNLNTNAME
jgi:hypothetical protein